jgi:uncharacterized protein with GYD domain
MATYIMLLNWTQKGIESIKDSPNRVEAARKAFKAAGGEMRAFYLVQGRYDMVVIGEAPDEETAARLALAIGAQGNVRTETLRAFPEDQFRKMIASLP